MASVTIGDGGGGGVRDMGVGVLLYCTYICKYSGMPSMRSPMGQKKLAILKRVFYMKMHGGFCEAPKKSGLNNEVAVLPRWWKGGVSL